MVLYSLFCEPEKEYKTSQKFLDDLRKIHDWCDPQIIEKSALPVFNQSGSRLYRDYKRTIIYDPQYCHSKSRFNDDNSHHWVQVGRIYKPNRPDVWRFAKEMIRCDINVWKQQLRQRYDFQQTMQEQGFCKIDPELKEFLGH